MLFEIGKQYTEVAVMPVDVMQVNHIRPEPIQLPQDPSRSGAGLKPVFTADAGLRGLHPNIAEARAGYPRLMTIGPAAQNMVFNRTICEQLTNADTDLAGTANSAALEGVAARRSATKSEMVTSGSWPTAEITGMMES